MMDEFCEMAKHGVYFSTTLNAQRTTFFKMRAKRTKHDERKKGRTSAPYPPPYGWPSLVFYVERCPLRVALALAFANAHDLRLAFKSTDDRDAAFRDLKMLGEYFNHGLVRAALLGRSLDQDPELLPRSFQHSILFSVRFDLDRVFHMNSQ